jgi:hypothetical protein
MFLTICDERYNFIIDLYFQMINILILFNDAFNYLDYVTSNYRRINE